MKQSKPNACIFDCNQALKCNPNSAKAHKLRGRANRALGNYLQAFHDLSSANQCDYNPDVYNEIKELRVKADAAREKDTKRRNREKKRELKKLKKRAKERREAIAKAKKAEEERKKKNMGGMPGGMPGAGAGGMPPGMSPEFMQKIMSDPELLA